jgi:hypothetical protein
MYRVEEVVLPNVSPEQSIVNPVVSIDEKARLPEE